MDSALIISFYLNDIHSSIGQKTPFKTFPGAEGLLRGSILFVVHRRAQEAKEKGKDPMQWIRLC